jgi:hypothetical protein
MTTLYKQILKNKKNKVFLFTILTNIKQTNINKLSYEI